MKKLFSLVASLLMLMIPVSLMAEETEVYYLQVYDYSGAATEFALTDKPVINIVGDSLTVTADSTEFSASLEDVKYYKYSSKMVDGIRTVETGVLVNSDNADVYTLDGTRVGKAANISALPKGVYVLRAGKQSFKFINK